MLSLTGDFGVKKGDVAIPTEDTFTYTKIVPDQKIEICVSADQSRKMQESFETVGTFGIESLARAGSIHEWERSSLQASVSGILS